MTFMIKKTYFPPKNWQDFENLIKDLSIEKFNSSFDLFGRSGQNQNGIDIIGNHLNQTIGIQCKHKFISRASSETFMTEIEFKTIQDEIEKVTNGSIEVDKLIIATTSFRDVNIQKEITKFNNKQQKINGIQIEIWFWQTIEEEIDANFNLLKKYYENVVPNFDLEFKEKHVITSIRNAFFRPAFLTPFKAENNGNDFLKAIQDIQELLSTGKLKTREGEYITGSVSFRNLSSSEDKQKFEDIYEMLQQIRDFTTLKIKEGTIKSCHPNCICVKDHIVENSLDDLRRDILNILNEILKRHDIASIQIRI